ncbi:hypothetical protein [Roseimicrobium sp. ORNL1]|uniref:tetratricopeptide repeat protein n=1 Tax=Roseimicrobium sp. ORNL1 TaxID=2711231 RepID=UPI0013E17500|nr:hypothetical protein [Roseimicrobium sp. ORNL1]QIF01516.1 hypothetical protein G5S37_08265 [Roseimicrobium sp. ORNL1]
MKFHALAARLVLSALVWGGSYALAEEAPRAVAPEASAALAEQRLREFPVFNRAFYGVMLAWDDWQALDKRWAGKQQAEPRFAILRGMLAERLGDFESARRHYAEGQKTDWARYHQGRFAALMGDKDLAVSELKEVATMTRDPWLFQQAALALGEIAMLREGYSGGEKAYAELWERRPEFAMRLRLLEPLLSLRAENAIAAGWLATLKPAESPAQGAGITSQAEQALLYFEGQKLLTGYTEPPPWVAEILKRPGTEAPLAAAWIFSASPSYLQLLLPEADDQWAVMQRLSEKGVMDDTMVGWWLTECLVRKGPETFLAEAARHRDRLQKQPHLFMEACELVTAKDAELVRSRLMKEIFAEAPPAVWNCLSLALRSRAGETAVALKQDALRAWQEVRDGEWVLPRRRITEIGVRGLRSASSPVWGQDTRLQSAGMEEPLSQVIWNLRGKEFTSALKVRFQQRLPDALGYEASYPDTMPHPLTLDPAKEPARVPIKTLAGAVWGMDLRRYLWEQRSFFGLEEAGTLEPMRKQGGEQAVFATLVDAPFEASLKHCSEATDLGKASLLPLLALRQKQEDQNKVSIYRTPLSQETRALRSAAHVRLGSAIRTRHPEWLLLVCRDGAPHETLPAVDPVTVDDLFGAIYTHNVSRAESTTSVNAACAKLNPEVAEAGRAATIMRAASLRMLDRLLPHGLAHLSWQPSLKRDWSAARTVVARHPGKESFYAASEPAPLSESARRLSLAEEMRNRGRARMVTQPNQGLMIGFSTIYGMAWSVPFDAREREFKELRDRIPAVKEYEAILEAQRALRMPAPAGSANVPRGPAWSSPSDALFKEIGKRLATVKTPRAQHALALLERAGGSEKAALEIAKGLEGREGTAGLLAAAIETGKFPQGTYQPSTINKAYIARSSVDMVEALVRGEENLRHIRRGNVERLMELHMRSLRGVRQDDLCKDMYQNLKSAREDGAAFASKARLMAMLARKLKLPDDEATDAELLDLQLNPNCADAWLWRARRYASTKSAKTQEEQAQNRKWAQDLFIEGLKRIDFENDPGIFYLLYPPHTNWYKEMFQSNRTDELADALGQALQATRHHQARPTAEEVLSAILDSPDTGARPGRVQRLLDIVEKNQPHLLRFRYSDNVHRVASLEYQNAPDSATAFARALLLSRWPEDTGVGAEKTLETSFNECKQQTNLGWIWGAPEYVEKKTEVTRMIATALREPHGTFVEDLYQVAKDYPKDEQSITVALLVKAMTGLLPKEYLSLLDDSDVMTRMRVAWKVSAYAPPENLPRRELAAMMVAGLKANLQDPQARKQVVAGLSVAPRLAKELERLGTKEELGEAADAVAVFINESRKDANFRFTFGWRPLSEMVLAHGAEVYQESLLQLWEESLLDDSLASRTRQPWVSSVLIDYESAYEQIGTRHGLFLARGALRSWSEQWKVLEGNRFTDVALWAVSNDTFRLVTLLLKAGAVDELEALSKKLDAVPSGPGMEYLTELATAVHRVQGLIAGGEDSVPLAVLNGEPRAHLGERFRVAWHLDAALTETSSSEVEFREEGNVLPAAFSQSLEELILPQLDGKYDLEIYAGARESVMRPIVSLKGVTATGSVELPDLPVSGWMRAVVTANRSGVSGFGAATRFSTAPALMNSQTMPGADVVQWGQGAREQYGVPISRAVPTVPGAEYLITLGEESRTSAGVTQRLERVTLVGLNSRKEPVAVWHANEELREGLSSEQNRSWVLKPDQWVAVDGWMGRRNLQEQADGEAIVYLALAARGEAAGDRTLQPLMVQPFGKFSGAAAPAVLESEFLAPLGFHMGAWHVSHSVPRAAFSAKGHITIYDTSTVPWKLLGMQRSNAILGRELIYVLNDSEAISLEMPTGGRKGSAIRRIRWTDNLEYEQRERTELPFTMEVRELHPEGKGLLMVGMNERSNEFRAAWIDSNGKVSELVTARSGPTSEKRKIVWWSDDDQVVVHDNGTLFHLSVKDGLSLVKSEPGTASAESMPKGATRGKGLRAAYWSLIKPRLLARQDPHTREVLATYILPENCKGSPIWLGEEDGYVILATVGNNIIRVKPPKTEEKKPNAESAPR